MNYFYLVMVLVCVTGMLTMMLHLHNNTVITKDSIHWWSVTYVGLSLVMLAEFFGAYLDVYSYNPIIHTIVTLTEFILTPVLPVALSCAVGVKKPARLIGLVALLQAAIELVLLPFGGIFYISADGFYHRGPFYVIYLASYVITYIYLMLMFSFISKKFTNRDWVTLAGNVVIILVGLIPSLINGQIKTAFLGISVASVIIYIYYEDLCQQDLTEKVAERNEKITNMQMHTIVGMANLIESRDGNTGDHVINTAKYVEILSNAAYEEKLFPEIIDDKYIELLVKAAPLHDVGKIVVSDNILNKPGRFTDEEFEIMKKHASEGERIVHRILEGVTDDDFTRIAVEVASCHHEKWNGTGYPKGLRGEEIPLSARIMAIADVYDALIAKRVYKEAMPPEEALDIISKDAGSHFDPVLAPLFVSEMRKSIS